MLRASRWGVMVHAYHPRGDKSTHHAAARAWTIVRLRLVQVNHDTHWPGTYYRGGG